MMKTFRARMTLWFGIGFVLVSTLTAVGALVGVVVGLRHDAKERLKELVDNIALQLQQSLDVEQTSLERATHVINYRLSFLPREADIDFGYALFDVEGKRVYAHHTGVNDPFAAYADASARDSYFFDEWSGLTSCTFYRWTDGEHFTILVCSSHRLTVIANVLAAYAIAFPLGMVLSVVAGRILAKKVVAPLEQIAATAARMRSGELSSRIATTSAGQEVEYVTEVLNSAFEEIDRSVQRIRQFSGDVAHELKTPLTALRGTLEVCLRRSRSEEEYQTAIADAVEEISELGGIVDDLLLLARPPGSRMDSDLQSTSMATILEKVRDGLEAFAEERGVGLEVDVASDAVVRGHEALLVRCVFNVMQNAVKFSEPGGQVTVRLRGVKGSAQIEVSDQGCGMPPAVIERVFDRLYRAPGVGAAGHGLGLSIARWVTELHGGRILVESREGEGSRFTIVLPADDVP